MDTILNFTDFKAKDPLNYCYSEDCDLYILNKVITNEVAVDELARELSSLPMPYTENDLHRFRQSRDLSDDPGLINIGLVSQFIHGMKTVLREFVEERFSVPTAEKITITASLYEKGDYLLCHDDLCNDRAVAFVYYLSDKHWTKDDGGILRFFQHSEGEPLTDKFRKELLPEFNSMVLFRVSKSSFHEVQEVFGDKSRLSINGWFHSPIANADHSKNNNSIEHPTYLRSPICQLGRLTLPENDVLEEPINTDYYDFVIQKELQRQFDENKVLLAGQILQDNWQAKVLDELVHATSWQHVGPPLHRRYESIPLKVRNGVEVLSEELPATKSLIECLIGSNWLHFLSYITKQDFTILDSEFQPPVFGGELQRWTEGCYSFVTDNDSFCTSGLNLMEVIIFLHVDVSESDDAGGQFVLTRSYNFTPRYYRDLGEIKKTRRRESMLNEEMEDKQRRRKGGVKIITRFNRRTKARMDEIVTEKMNKIEAYRKNLSWENTEIRPQPNSIIVAKTNKNMASFMTYLRHREPARACYYCVSLRYLTKDKACDYSDSESDSQDTTETKPLQE